MPQHVAGVDNELAQALGWSEYDNSKMKTLALFPLLCCLAGAQSGAPAAQTNGGCSPAVTASGATITIKTCGLSNAQVAEWRAAIQQFLAKQIDPKVLVALLDDIKSRQIRIEKGALKIGRAGTAVQHKYLPGGMKIVAKPEGIIAEEGESAMFKRMVDAQGARDGDTLLKLCDEEVAKVPEWLTPYAFRGIALFLLSRNPEAIQQLNLFIEASAGDIQFADMRADAIRSRDTVPQKP